MKNIKYRLLSAGAIVIGFVSVAIIGGALVSSADAARVSSAGAADNECSYSIGDSKYIKPEYPVNANGQTYSDDTVHILANDYPDLPDLIGVIATNGKAGYVYKEDMYDYMPSCPEEAVKYMEVLKELNDQGIYYQIIPVYAVDGETVIGDFEECMDVGMCGGFSMDEAGAIYGERRKLHEESRAKGKYLRESMASVMERAMAKDKK